MSHDDDTCPHLVRANLLEAENARLKAEVERLEARIEYVDNLANQYALDDVRSQAHIERLTKAGDELERVLTSHISSYEVGNASFQWRASKEGKQP